MESLYLTFTEDADKHAFQAGDLLIAALWALNATDTGYPNRPDTRLGRLAFQEKASPYQQTRDALEGILRALSEDFDPEGLTIDTGMDCVCDVMGESNATRSVIAAMRDRYESITAVDTD